MTQEQLIEELRNQGFGRIADLLAAEPKAVTAVLPDAVIPPVTKKSKVK